MVQGDSGQALGGQGRAPDKFRVRVFFSSFPRAENYETLSELFFGSSSDDTGAIFCDAIFSKHFFLEFYLIGRPST